MYLGAAGMVTLDCLKYTPESLKKVSEIGLTVHNVLVSNPKIISESDILNSGLFYFDEKNKKYIERFRGRILFPINGLTGSTVAFGGRTISDYKLAKYIFAG